MNTLSPVRVAIRVAAASAVAIGFTAGAMALDTPTVPIPILPAGLSGALLVALGYILGRASLTRHGRPINQTRAPQQVTATVTRTLPEAEPYVVAAARVILPATKDGGTSA